MAKFYKLIDGKLISCVMAWNNKYELNINVDKSLIAKEIVDKWYKFNSDADANIFFGIKETKGIICPHCDNEIVI